MHASVERFCQLLGYRQGDGLLEPSQFASAAGVAQTLWAAHEWAGLQACFGAWESGWAGVESRRFTPLVYVARARDDVHAQQIHRWVWSQGKVPCLVILCGRQAILCSGFRYQAGTGWAGSVQHEDLPPEGAGQDRLSLPLRDLAADRLQASVTWRDFTQSGNVGVDSALLEGLEALHAYLAESVDAKKHKVTPNLVNRLIGRVVYTYLLIDRKIIDVTKWVTAAADGTPSEHVEVGHDAFWRLQDHIDSIFNGGVFQIGDDERQSITPDILNLANAFIRKGEKFDGKYRQRSLFSIDLSAVRVETLSAVYEKFLRTESNEAADRDGVVYTRPFLVDFMLNRVADSCAFTEDTKVLDPTAGSGVFLVAAFRHIVERKLAGRVSRGKKRFLPLQQLQELLTGCIFGVEKSRSAAQVAAFSLYLNLLDYIDPAELAEKVRGIGSDKIFPPLLENNICIADFFSRKRFFKHVTFDVAVGNPPWKPLHHVTDHHDKVEKFEIEWFDASQHVAWSMVKHYLKPGGRLALVLPAKTFAAPAAGRFITAFASHSEIDLVVNMSSWRRHLFDGAEDPAALLFAFNRRSRSMSRTWFYMPRLWSQPFKPEAMWMLAVDRADVNSLPSALAFANSESVFDAFVLKPYDRRVKQRLFEAYGGEKATSLRALMGEAGLELTRGVTALELGVPGAVRASSTDLRPDMQTLRHAVIDDLEPVFAKNPGLRKLSVRALKGKKFATRCSGPRLILARSMQYCYCTAETLAVNPTFNLLYCVEEDAGMKEEKLLLLSRLGEYLMSDFARYQFALFGKLWQIDGKRAEKSDLEQIVVPSLSSLQSSDNWDCSGASAKEVLDRMDMGEFLSPLNDYVAHRRELENARVPAPRAVAASPVPDDYLNMLEGVFRSRLNDDVITAKAGTLTSVMAEVVVDFGADLGDSAWGVLNDGPGYQFLDSAWLKKGPNRASVIICKPRGVEHLTLERAYSDGLHVINSLFLH
jgi:hypothetical protein